MARAGLLVAALAALAVAAAERSTAAPSCSELSNRAWAYQQRPGHTKSGLARLEKAALACASGRQRIGFWPQGGQLDHDLYLANTVDLDDGPSLRDPWCDARTYDTHTGEDVTIRSFREQAIGVPVFAALDGRVRRVQEGQKDTNYGTQTLPWDNHVEVDSGHGQVMIYGHLRRGSVRVKDGAWVVAGQQIGLTGSSGNSSWPHLHLTMIVGDEPSDLWSGPCNSTSYWQVQPAVRTDPFARDFTVSAEPFTDHADLPWDDAVRTSAFAAGIHDLWFRSMLFNAQNASSQLVQLIRPDGSIALADPSTPAWLRWRQTHATWHERLDLDVSGTCGSSCRSTASGCWTSRSRSAGKQGTGRRRPRSRTSPVPATACGSARSTSTSSMPIRTTTWSHTVTSGGSGRGSCARFARRGSRTSCREPPPARRPAASRRRTGH
jgi:murein DD-endopeptidase MepM/ murein hydrolase activator NlpD